MPWKQQELQAKRKASSLIPLTVIGTSKCGTNCYNFSLKGPVRQTICFGQPQRGALRRHALLPRTKSNSPFVGIARRGARGGLLAAAAWGVLASACTGFRSKRLNPSTPYAGVLPNLPGPSRDSIFQPHAFSSSHNAPPRSGLDIGR